MSKGYVYAIGCGDHAIKFGVANDPFRRLSDLQVANPLDLAMLAMIRIEGGRRDLYCAERTIHRAFRRFLIRGEWYQNNRQTRILATVIAGGNYDFFLRILRRYEKIQDRWWDSSTYQLTLDRDSEAYRANYFLLNPFNPDFKSV